jgi:hypothetical protein
MLLTGGRKIATLVAALTTLVVSVNGLSSRQTLLKTLTVYTDSLMLKNTSTIPVAPSVRVTNNGDVTTLGNGTVWNTPGTIYLPYRQVLVDTETGAVALRATVSNATSTNSTAPAQWWFYSLRLKIINDKITEVEEFTDDTSFAFASVPASSLTMPDRIWGTIIPEEERATRSELQETVNNYFNVLSGTVRWQDGPFHPECQRLEVGVQTVNEPYAPGSCGTEFLNPVLQGLNIVNRRFYVVDTIRGEVAAIANFDGPPGAGTGSVILEEFKVENGLIRHIEAFFNLQGQATAGWPT